MAVDVLIKGATIVDGTGDPRYVGDIAIKDGKITAIGDTGETGGKVIDATGLAATPGFWDVHTHYDAQLVWDPLASSSTWHGVTNVVTGNCGFTIAPVKTEDQDYMMRLLAQVESINQSALTTTLPWPWETFPEYLDYIDTHAGVNVVAMVGHSAVRRYVMGKEANQREATEEEIEKMRLVVRESLRAGGMGITSSRGGTHYDGDGGPVPSRLSSSEENWTLALEARGMNRGFLQGMGPPDFMKELTATVGLPFLASPITQVVTDPPDSWKKELLSLENEIENGVRVFGMGPVFRRQNEMVVDNTNLFDRWPMWHHVMAASVDEQKKMMRDNAVRDKLREELKTQPIPILPFSWDLVTMIESPTGRWKHLEGKNVVQMAAELGKDPLDAFFDVTLDEDLKTYYRIRDTRYPDQDVLIDIVKAPHILVGMTDAGAHMVTIVETGFPTHLLGYWARERQAISVEEAVYILAGRPADELGVKDRGRLLPGQAADVVLMDLDKVAAGGREFAYDLPGGERRLVEKAVGIEAVMVNGVVERRGDRDTGDLNGGVIRSTWSN
ncbi:amidohydrolase family protein [Dehalococcoidia bacterium]|nr:amidohydrolase family protein [Dehalococcoidia bacterium]